MDIWTRKRVGDERSCWRCRVLLAVGIWACITGRRNRIFTVHWWTKILEKEALTRCFQMRDQFVHVATAAVEHGADLCPFQSQHGRAFDDQIEHLAL